MNSDGKTSVSGMAEGVDARRSEHDLHLRVPALDAVFEVDGEDADVDGLDDVLVEVVQALVLEDLRSRRR